MKRARRQEASDILDLIKSGIEAGADDDKLIGFINDVLTCLIYSDVAKEREACAKLADVEEADLTGSGTHPYAVVARKIAKQIRDRKGIDR